MKLEELKEFIYLIDDVPTMDKMPRKTLKIKGINGPTSAHFIEEIHTPLNFNCLTFTTGTSAFQNIVGVIEEELFEKKRAALKALDILNIREGDRMLVTYPPLINVFSKEALEEKKIKWNFLEKSSRDAVIYDICKNKPEIVIGESNFLRVVLEDAKKTGLIELFPNKIKFIAAGTSLDLELLESCKNYKGFEVHDLYGAQEFGWICLDGIPLRGDIALIKSSESDFYDLIVGGVSSGDCFLVSELGHICNKKGKIITYTKKRIETEYETIILEAPVNNEETLRKFSKTMLRIKSKIIRIAPDVKLESKKLVVGLKYYNNDKIIKLDGELIFLENILEGQMNYQKNSKKDNVWNKRS